MELNDKDKSQNVTLASVGRKIPFNVPDAYFEQLTATIQNRIRLEEVRFNEEEEFKLPKGYFEELASKIEDRLIVDKLPAKDVTGGFSMPEGYFDHLSEGLKHKIATEKPNVPVRKMFSGWVSYAAAACVTIAITTTIILSGSSAYQVDKKLSEVSDQEIINYLQVHSTAADTPFIIESLSSDQLEEVHPDVSPEELEQYLNTTTL